jgi:hypothetical protein
VWSDGKSTRRGFRTLRAFEKLISSVEEEEVKKVKLMRLKYINTRLWYRFPKLLNEYERRKCEKRGKIVIIKCVRRLSSSSPGGYSHSHVGSLNVDVSSIRYSLPRRLNQILVPYSLIKILFAQSRVRSRSPSPSYQKRGSGKQQKLEDGS